MIFTLLLLISIIYKCNSLKKPVLKFGGSSLAGIDRLNNVCNIVRNVLNEGEIPIVVLSAMGDTTNKLLKASELSLKNDDIKESKKLINDIKSSHYMVFHYVVNHSNKNIDVNFKEKFYKDKEDLKLEIDGYFDDILNIISGINILKELSPSVRDQVSSYGERLSVRLFSFLLNNMHLNNKRNNILEAKKFDSWNIGLRTYGNFGDSKFMEDNIIKNNICNIIESEIINNKIPIVTGFICKNSEGRITTIGRGGSDLTATFIGECCKSEEIQVWKDVNGLMTADPKLVNNAKEVSKLSYEQASELAYFGAKILHPISMLPAKKSSIPVIIKNSYNISNPGTIISNVENNDKDKKYIVAMAAKKDITLIDIVSTRMMEQAGFLSKVFVIFKEEDISIDVIATSEISISLTLDSKNNISDRAITKLKEISCVYVKKDYSILSFISNIEKSNDVLYRVLKILSDNKIKVEMISQGASKVNISIVIKSSEVNKALNLIHSSFF